MQPDEPDSQLPQAFSSATGWQAFVVAGVVTVILGLIIALHPSGSLNVLAVLIGVLLLISGLFYLIRVFDPSEPHRVWLGIAGLLLVVIGVVLIRHLDLTVALVGLVVGITWIVQGLAALVTGLSGPAGERRGPSTRIIWALRPPVLKTMAPPTTALSERSRTSGWRVSSSSTPNRTGTVAPHLHPGGPCSQACDSASVNRASESTERPRASSESTWKSIERTSSGVSTSSRNASKSS